MGNMSYCRFQNTLLDLQECAEKLDEIDGDVSLLSGDEREAAEELILLCAEIHYNYNEWRK